MRLTINGETVSYSLENEKTLGEVVGGVRAWLAASGFVMTALTADHRDLVSEPRSSWAATDIASVESLDVAAEHTGDMKVSHWRTVDAWLAMLEEELRGTEDGARAGETSAARTPGAAAMDPLDELLSGLPQTLEGFAANPFLPPGSDAEKRFHALWLPAPDASRPLSAADVRAWPPERAREAAAVIQDLRTRVQKRIEDSTHPRETLARGARMLKESLDGLREVSVLLQTGKDKAAMGILIGFTDAAQSLIDILPFCAPDPDRARALTELIPVLRELVTAFDSRDSVLIGDLLEYEVAPRIERLAPLLERAVQ